MQGHPYLVGIKVGTVGCCTNSPLGRWWVGGQWVNGWIKNRLLLMRYLPAKVEFELESQNFNVVPRNFIFCYV